jgi:hypothetical protein
MRRTEERGKRDLPEVARKASGEYWKMLFEIAPKKDTE